MNELSDKIKEVEGTVIRGGESFVECVVTIGYIEFEITLPTSLFPNEVNFGTAFYLSMDEFEKPKVRHRIPDASKLLEDSDVIADLISKL